MTGNPDRLFERLPAYIRQQDARQGYPLRSLLQVITEQVGVVEADIDRLYDNWFIETADDWVVPYIGELVGYQPVLEAAAPDAPAHQAAHHILVPRREVAHTIAWRRRKGTLALLEELGREVAGWPGRAVEFYRLLDWTQALNHQRQDRGRWVDLRDGDALGRLDGPFDELAHTAGVRRINSGRTAGWYSLLNVGLFVWRLQAFSVSRSPAYCQEEVAPHCYTFSVLGNDAPLYTLPEPEPEPTHIAGELNVPTPIRLRSLEERLPGTKKAQASGSYYGLGKSLAIWCPDWPQKGATQPIPRERVIPANLDGWVYQAPRGSILVDPERGRIVFPKDQRPRVGVWVTYHYGFSAPMGGGEYDRPIVQPEPPEGQAAATYRVAKSRDGFLPSLEAALKAWQEAVPQPSYAVIEIADSGVYTEPVHIRLKAGQYLQVRAANRTRPVIRLLDYVPDLPDAFSIMGEPGSRFTLDGLLVTGRSIQVMGPELTYDEKGQAPPPGPDLCAVTIRHCTLVPGWTLHEDCRPRRPAEPSLELVNTGAHVRIEQSIVGSILVIGDVVETDPIRIDIADSIVDATGSDCDSPECQAVSGTGGEFAHATLTLRDTTVFGRVRAHSIALAENSIFMGQVWVARRQTGCMRFCYVTPGSRTPRRYLCQPDKAIAALGAASADAELVDQTALRVRPTFTATRYGLPGYAQLALACAEEIRRGAEDESEMGAFHDLYQPQREAALRARLAEYTPAGMDAGIIFAS